MSVAQARDAILLVGDIRLRRVLGIIGAPRVFSAMLPLDTICILEREAAGLHTVVVSTTLAWGAELREMLAAEHPGIRVLLVAPTG